MPLKGRVTSLAVDVRNVFPDWRLAVGTAEAFIEGFSYDGWDAPETSVGVTLDEGGLSAKLAGRALGSDFAVDGRGEFELADLQEEGFVIDGITGNLRVEKLAQVLRALDRKLEWGGRFKEFPASSVTAKWELLMDGALPSGVSVDLEAKAADEGISPIRLDAKYEGKLITLRGLNTEGREISGTFDTQTQGYALKESMKNFRTESIAAWLKGVGVGLPGAGVFSLEWDGSGNLLANSHKGELRAFSGTWESVGEGKAPIIAEAGQITYDWPGEVTVKDLAVETEGQTLRLDAELAGDELKLGGFTWLDGESQLAAGKGTMPVPRDFTKWKEFIANDTRPLDLTLKSETLPLAKLRPWVKGLDMIDEKATGKIDVRIGGSFAEPEVDAMVEIRDVSVPGKKEIPKTDVTLELKAREGRAAISAKALAADYAPAILKAEMAFLPKRWAENPDSLMAEEIKGTLDLPRLELSRFQSLIPGALELGGVTTGKVVIAGTVGEPQVDGDLKLSGGKLRMQGNTIPELSGIGFEMNANFKTIAVKGAVDDIAGGNIKMNGTMELTNATGDGLGPLEVSLKGVGLPLLRNEFLILRANADLRLAGTIHAAQLSGEVAIIDSVFFKDIELLPIGKPFLGPAASSLPKVDVPAGVGAVLPPPFNAWTTDVVVKTIDPILIRGNLGRGRVDVGLRISGKLGDPKPDGKVRITEAQARLPFSSLLVREGFLTFTPANGFDPTIEIRGSAEPRPYRVQVYAYGRMSDPQLVLTSEPPLPENEIMTLLATGTTSAGLEDSQAASSRAMQLLIEELRRGRFLFGKQLRPLLGLLDDVDFSLAETDPYDSDSYSSATLKLSEKWFITAGLGSEGDQRIMAIWRLRFR